MSKAAADYFPLQPGLVLEYRTKDSSSQGRVIIEVVSVSKKPKTTQALLRRITEWGGPAKTLEYPVLRDTSGVYTDGEKEFPFPLTLGRKWSRRPNEYTVDALDAVVKVPAGTFRGCLRVSYLIGGGDAGSGERYYAPGIGFVYEACADEIDPYEFALTASRRPGP